MKVKFNDKWRIIDFLLRLYFDDNFWFKVCKKIEFHFWIIVVSESLSYIPSIYLPSGNVFTPVCHSVHAGGGASGRHPQSRHPKSRLSWSRHPQSRHPPGTHPSGGAPPSRPTPHPPVGTHPPGMHSSCVIKIQQGFKDIFPAMFYTSFV